jgi:hypothetical protein
MLGRSLAVALALSAAGCATSGDGSVGGDDDAGLPPPPVDASRPAQDATRPAQDTGVPDAAPPFDAGIDVGIDSAPACTEMDAGCTTPNPGACFPGTYHCDDAGMQVCVPNLTTQACYTGPAGTENVGVCKGGTQSCVGPLGACMGEVTPAAHENCFNGLDNDCSGEVGNGCPVSVSLGPDRIPASAGGPGGGLANLHCPAGAYVTRVDSWFDDGDQHASGVSIYCATPTLNQGASSYSITLTPNTPAPYQTVTGSNGNAIERSDDCGISGLIGVTYEVGVANTYVNGLGSHCGTSAVTLNPDNTIPISFVPDGSTQYNYYSSTGGTYFDITCASNEVVVGYALHVGSWMDNIAPICAQFIVNYKP